MHSESSRQRRTFVAARQDTLSRIWHGRAPGYRRVKTRNEDGSQSPPRPFNSAQKTKPATSTTSSPLRRLGMLRWRDRPATPLAQKVHADLLAPPATSTPMNESGVPAEFPAVLSPLPTPEPAQ